MAQSDRRVPRPSQAQQILLQAVQVGAASGGVGFIVGATAGVFRSSPPVLFGTASGLQWFGLSSTFWLSRSAILAAWHEDTALAAPRDALYASTIAGGFSGAALALITRGRRNVIPGAIMFSIFGALGQAAVNTWKARPAPAPIPQGDGSIVKWIARQKWSPFSILTNDEYQRILQEKILKLDVEIALADERLASMKKQHEAEVSAASLGTAQQDSGATESK